MDDVVIPFALLPNFPIPSCFQTNFFLTTEIVCCFLREGKKLRAVRTYVRITPNCVNPPAKPLKENGKQQADQ